MNVSLTPESTPEAIMSRDVDDILVSIFIRNLVAEVLVVLVAMGESWRSRGAWVGAGERGRGRGWEGSGERAGDKAGEGMGSGPGRGDYGGHAAGRVSRSADPVANSVTGEI